MAKSMSLELLPLMLVAGRHGGRTVRGLHLPPEGFLRDMAPYLPETAQPRVLQAASILQAGREMRRCCEFTPPAQPRKADPLELMQTLGRYLPADGPGQGMLRQLGRMRQFRQMFRLLGSQSVFGTSTASSSALGSQSIFGASAPSGSALGSQDLLDVPASYGSAFRTPPEPPPSEGDFAPGDAPPAAFPALSPEMLGTLLRLSRNLSASAGAGTTA